VHGLVGEVLGDHALVQAVGTDEHDVGGRAQPVEGEEILDLGAIDLLRPAPVEVGDGLEGAQAGAAQAALEPAACAFFVLPGKELGEPGLMLGLLPVGEQAVELEGTSLTFEVAHGSSSGA
jgi:hypothetical protein